MQDIGRPASAGNGGIVGGAEKDVTRFSGDELGSAADVFGPGIVGAGGAGGIVIAADLQTGLDNDVVGDDLPLGGSRPPVGEPGSRTLSIIFIPGQGLAVPLVDEDDAGEGRGGAIGIVAIGQGGDHFGMKGAGGVAVDEESGQVVDGILADAAEVGADIEGMLVMNGDDDQVGARTIAAVGGVCG